MRVHAHGDQSVALPPQHDAGQGTLRRPLEDPAVAYGEVPLVARALQAVLLPRVVDGAGRDPGGSVLVERINQQDLAEITGTSVYTVSRTLADWQELKIVETGRQRLRICGLQSLAGIAEGSGAHPGTA